MKLFDLQKHLEQALRGHGIDAADQEARIMLEERLGLSWADLIMGAEREIDSAVLEADLQKRLSGMPLGRIYGRRNFYGLEFTLSSGTLEPRADTEVLIDRALDLYRSTPPVRILDLGTGTGCILLTLLKHWPKSEGVGVDIAHDALETARRNASYHKLTERVSFIEGNWGEGLAGGFDLVVSNPPYIERDVIKSLPDEVRLHDPILALDGGTDGMDAYKVIFSQLPVLLKPEGRALFEIGYDQSRKIERLAEDHGFKVEAIHPDSAGRARVAEVLRRA